MSRHHHAVELLAVIVEFDIHLRETWGDIVGIDNWITQSLVNEQSRRLKYPGLNWIISVRTLTKR